MFQITPVVKNLLIVNIAIMVFNWLLQDVLSTWLALYYIGSDFFAPYQFITYMFLHGGFGHIFGNMLALFFFGPWLERSWGPQRFFIFYMICGVGAGVLFGIAQTIEMQMLQAEINAYLSAPGPDAFVGFINSHAPNYYSSLYDFINTFSENPESTSLIGQSRDYLNQIFTAKANVPMVGASGAVFGILLGFGMLFPNTEIFLLFPPIPIKAKYLVTFYGLYEIYALFQNNPNDNVAHLAHVGGMIFAFFLIQKWKGTSTNF